MSDYRTEVDKQIRAFVLRALGHAEEALKKGNVESAESLHTCAQKMFSRRREESPLEDLDIASKGLQVGLEIRRQKLLAEMPEDKTEISYTEKFAAFVREATPAMVALLKLKSSAGGQTDGARDEAANGEAAAENIADAAEKSKSGVTTRDDVLNFLAELAELNVKHGVDIISPRGFYLAESLERTEDTEDGAEIKVLAKSGYRIVGPSGRSRYPTEWVDEPKEDDFRNYPLELKECQANLEGAEKTIASLREDLDHAKRVISLKDTEISQLKTAYNALIDDYDEVSRELSAARESLRSMAAAFKVHRAVSQNYIKI